MEKIKKLYIKLWKLFIRPERIHYFESDIGPYEYIYDENKIFIKRVFKLHNILNEEFHVSIYIPKKIKENFDVIVYCHTQNGNRVEGNFLFDYAFENNFGLCLFDFRANGASTGKYLTLGYLECLDLNSWLFFLKNTLKVKRICLWGRSMGGASIIFFLSKSFRKIISDHLKKNYNKDKIFWVSRNTIDCVILDSVFSNIFSSSIRFVSSKNNKVPNFLIEIALNLINKGIVDKIKISLNEISPNKFIKELNIPCFLFIGRNDELVDLNEFMNMFKLIDQKIKKFKIIDGYHTDERDEYFLLEVLNFIKYVFNSKNNLNKEDWNKDIKYYDKPEDIFKMVKDSKIIYNENNTQIFKDNNRQKFTINNDINSYINTKNKNATQINYNKNEKNLIKNNKEELVKSVKIEKFKNPVEDIPVLKELKFADDHGKYLNKNKFEKKRLRDKKSNIKIKFNKEENNIEINPEYIKNGEIYYNNNENNSISNLNEKMKKNNNFFSNKLDVIDELNYKEEEINDLKIDYKNKNKKLINKNIDLKNSIVFKLEENDENNNIRNSLALINGIEKINKESKFYKFNDGDNEDKELLNFFN